MKKLKNYPNLVKLEDLMNWVKMEFTIDLWRHFIPSES